MQDGPTDLLPSGVALSGAGSRPAVTDAGEEDVSDRVRERIRALIRAARELSDTCADLADALRPLPGTEIDDPLTMDFGRLRAERTAALLDEAASAARGTLGLLDAAHGALADSAVGTVPPPHDEPTTWPDAFVELPPRSMPNDASAVPLRPTGGGGAEPAALAGWVVVPDEDEEEDEEEDVRPEAAADIGPREAADTASDAGMDRTGADGAIARPVAGVEPDGADVGSGLEQGAGGAPAEADGGTGATAETPDASAAGVGPARRGPEGAPGTGETVEGQEAAPGVHADSDPGRDSGLRTEEVDGTGGTAEDGADGTATAPDQVGVAGQSPPTAPEWDERATARRAGVAGEARTIERPATAGHTPPTAPELDELAAARRPAAAGDARTIEEPDTAGHTPPTAPELDELAAARRPARAGSARTIEEADIPGQTGRAGDDARAVEEPDTGRASLTGAAVPAATQVASTGPAGRVGGEARTVPEPGSAGVARGPGAAVPAVSQVGPTGPAGGVEGERRTVGEPGAARQADRAGATAGAVDRIEGAQQDDGAGATPADERVGVDAGAWATGPGGVAPVPAGADAEPQGAYDGGEEPRRAVAAWQAPPRTLTVPTDTVPADMDDDSETTGRHAVVSADPPPLTLVPPLGAEPDPAPAETFPWQSPATPDPLAAKTWSAEVVPGASAAGDGLAVHPLEPPPSPYRPAEPYRPTDPYRTAEPYRPTDPYRTAEPYPPTDPYRSDSEPAYAETDLPGGEATATRQAGSAPVPAGPLDDPAAAVVARQIEAARRHLQAALVVASQPAAAPQLGALLTAVERALTAVTDLARETRGTLEPGLAERTFPGEARFLCSTPWEQAGLVGRDTYRDEAASPAGLAKLLRALGYEAQSITSAGGVAGVQVRSEQYAAHIALVEPATGGRQRWSGALEWVDAAGASRTWAETLGPVELEEEELARRVDELLRRSVGAGTG